MKIAEILIIGINQDYKDFMLSVLALDGHSIADVDIYQLEIDSELKVLFYDLDLDHRIPEEFIEHIKPHLAGVLIITDLSFSLKSIPKRDFVNSLIVELSDLGSGREIPIIVAVGFSGEEQGNISESLEISGFYLSKSSRMLLWNSENIDSIKKIWRSLLVDLQKENSTLQLDDSTSTRA
jgi:hypothetical protein